LRIAKETISILRRRGIPRLGPSNLVLFDHWESKWPRWGDAIIDWLFDQDCQPVMAHPERTASNEAFVAQIERQVERGVWLQGNLKSFTKATERIDPYTHEIAHRLLREDRYHMLALDMHRTETLAERFEGYAAVEAVVGRAKLDELTITHPRRVVEFTQPRGR
jgi:tyrosine-protein phosphatase YwqE